jgi:hypothetical protein
VEKSKHTEKAAENVILDFLPLLFFFRLSGQLGLDMSSTINMFLSSFVADSLLPWRFQRTARKPLMLWQKPAVFPTILMSNDIPVWKI